MWLVSFDDDYRCPACGCFFNEAYIADDDPDDICEANDPILDDDDTADAPPADSREDA
jgi:hypothetical protein